MRTVTDWRSAATADDFSDLDNAGFAQEFLRRNPDYCRGYHDLVRRIAAEGLDEAAVMEEYAHRWGLSFPVPPRLARRLRTGALGARSGRRHRRP